MNCKALQSSPNQKYVIFSPSKLCCMTQRPEEELRGKESWDWDNISNKKNYVITAAIKKKYSYHLHIDGLVSVVVGIGFLMISGSYDGQMSAHEGNPTFAKTSNFWLCLLNDVYNCLPKTDS